MRILVTNDDGVSAPGLAVSEAIASAVAGPEGDVWVVAPAFEQSGVGHALSYNKPIQVERLAERRFAVSGTPADCVILGVNHFMDAKPDLVISGVNRGHNLAEDSVVSGTLGGAIQGALQGVRAVALSQYYHFDRSQPTPTDAATNAATIAAFAPARAHGAAAIARLLDEATADRWPEARYFSVNFPPVPADAVKGRRFVAQGKRRGASFDAEARTSPGGKPYYWLRHRVDNDSAGPDSDAALCKDGWITIAPMRADYTDVAALDALQSAAP